MMAKSDGNRGAGAPDVAAYLDKMREKDQVAKVFGGFVEVSIYEPFKKEVESVVSTVLNVRKALAVLGYKYISGDAAEEDILAMAEKTKEIMGDIGMGDLGSEIDKYVSMLQGLRVGIDSDKKLSAVREREKKVSDADNDFKHYV